MTIEREQLAKTINSRLCQLAWELKTRTRNGLTDGPKVLEVVMLRFLNALKGWELTDLNQDHPNYPAADLGDKTRGIAVQVTNTDDRGKLADTRAKALDPAHAIGRDFDTLYLLYFVPTKPNPPKGLLQSTDRPQIKTWDLSDLLGQMLHADIERLRAALDVLEEELPRHGVSVPTHPPVICAGKLPDNHAAQAQLLGRGSALRWFETAWCGVGTHVLCLVGIGGEGKTALAIEWRARLSARHFDGADYFEWSFYSQGAHESTGASSHVFLAAAVDALVPGVRSRDFTGPTAASDMVKSLLAHLRRRRTLLILDGIEPLQRLPTAEKPASMIHDSELSALVTGLAHANAGLCLLTTRVPVAELQSTQRRTSRQVKLSRLPALAGAHLLHQLGVTRAAGRALQPDDPELRALVNKVQGHALTLRLLANYLRLNSADGRHGDVRQWRGVLAADADIEFMLNDRDREANQPYGHAFKVISAYERRFLAQGQAGAVPLAYLRLLGLFDRPAKPDCLRALEAAPAIAGITEPLMGLRTAERNRAWDMLRKLGLLVRDETAATQEDSAGQDLDAHPLLRYYFAARLRKENLDAFRAAHSRLFDHLCATTEHRPGTLPGLQPLYQAVTHGCLAGRQQEACDKVYFDRILRGTGHDGFYSRKKLGAIGADLGAVAAFFDEPWTRLSPNLSAPDQAWLLNEAAISLRSLGRLTEAVEPMRVGLEMRIKQEVWKSAAIIASNLSELEVTLGRLGEAVADGRRAIEFADRSGDAFLKMAFRTTAADALHQAGERAQAGALFAEAERMQAETQPQFPLLYSSRGFQYADLLLAPAERTAWAESMTDEGRRMKGGQPQPDSSFIPHPSSLLDSPLAACAEAERRAAKLFEWRVPNDPLLDIALDHLTQARAALYRALLTSAGKSEIRNPKSEIETALARLRAANQSDYLPKALLTAALYHGTLGGDPAACARLLDEAQQIAERGPMPLYLADVHLHRARLAGRMNEEGRMKNFPDVDPKAELAKARALIEQHEYWRRREELADAEAATPP